MSTAITITDTGKRNPSDSSATYTKVNSGTAISLSGFSLIYELTTNTGTNVGTRNEDNSNLTFIPNEITAIQSPRLTLRGLILASETAQINNIIKLGRSKGVKTIVGGLGTLAALPGYSSGLSVIVKNITFTEVVTNDKTYANFTIQLEQTQ